MQELERLFMLEEQLYKVCSEGHYDATLLQQRFHLRLDGQPTSDGPMLDHKALQPMLQSGYRKVTCLYCGSSDKGFKGGFYARKPEVLIIECPFRDSSGSQTFEQYSYRVRLENEISICPKDKERYVLTGVVMVTGNSWKTNPGHVVATVRAPDGLLKLVSDNTVIPGGTSWHDVEGAQFNKNLENVFLPHLLIYRRKHEPESAPQTFPRGSLSDDPAFEKAAIAIKLAFQHIHMDDVLLQLRRHNASIQNTVNFFLTGRDTQIQLNLDNVSQDYLEDVVKAYTKYPHLSVEKICQALKECSGNFDYALKTLDDLAGRRVTFSSQEIVGCNGLRSTLDVVDDQFVDGECHFIDTTTKTRRTARVFGKLIRSEYDETPSNSPRGKRFPRSSRRSDSKGAEFPEAWGG